VCSASEIFKEYFELMNYQQAAEMGYSLLDIFYWEHRCGTWVSEVLQQTDFAFNTHALINSRKVLEALLSIEYSERKSAKVFKHIIDKNLGKLPQFPINPKEFGCV